jgi:hypothetical protein
METWSKNQIVTKTNCTFYVWTPKVNPLRVTKKELKVSLKGSVSYSVDCTITGTISYGKRKGQDWMAYVIAIC